MAIAEVPSFFTRAMLVIRLFLVGRIMLRLSDAAQHLDFPGQALCLNDSMRIWIPHLLGKSSWHQLSVLNSKGEPMDCEYTVDKLNLQITAHSNCMNYEGSTRYLTIQFITITDEKYSKPTYNITCEDLQQDQSFQVPEVKCGDDMYIAISRSLPDFQDEGSRSASSSWHLEIKDSVTQTTYTWTPAEARPQGYRLINDPVNNDLIIRVQYNGTGIQKFQQDASILYLANIGLLYFISNQRIQINVLMICMPGPYVCNVTHLAITIPSFPGTLSAISIDQAGIPMSQLPQNGITLHTPRGIQLYFEKSFLKKNKCISANTFISILKLTFIYKGDPIQMVISPECQCAGPSPPMCNADGFMDFEVVAASTIPNLNLRTVRVRDSTCLPYNQSSDKVFFHIPLNGCSTTIKYEGTNAVYENEVRALWIDLPPSVIARESEFRMTVQCFYNENAEAVVRADVGTPVPLITLAQNDGPISFLLKLFPDQSYMSPFSDQQYPVVKRLREPVFLEVQLLNQNDTNIELVLNDCWATASKDPKSVPKWNIIVDGCNYQNDNYRTVFHPVGFQVQYPSHRKRFEVKTFAFVSGNAQFANLVYFHCTALICNTLAPDSPICTKVCPRSRRRRGISLRLKENLASLPGPVMCERSEYSGKSKGPIVIPVDEFPTHFNETALSMVVIALICVVVVYIGLRCRSTANSIVLVK
ncbi:zona pellucida sperm-binding protein 2-like isoform X2 [Ambystoma mexicanum]|uniref:zona pellucida sperm-binding protein 2-like isoform X2 n=1 Tax=Ambystoma mexicanum TaxID=8296 RepID=UPI0037E8D52B